jgi:hypothetical protein
MKNAGTDMINTKTGIAIFLILRYDKRHYGTGKSKC